MTPDSPENYLPDILRCSELPWEPWLECQARCPRDGDGWTAHVGELRFELHADLEPGSPAYELRLICSCSGRERSSWALPSLEHASVAASSVHQMLLRELLQEVRDASR